MRFLENKIVVSEISIAVFVPHGTGAPIHRNRPFHGLAYNDGCDTTYRFDNQKIITCHSGECIYLPRFSNYTVDRNEPATDDKTGVYAINFSIFHDLEAKEPFKVKVKNRKKVLASFVRSESAWRKKQIGYEEELFSNLYEIIRILKSEAADYQPLGQTLAALSPALQYMEENYTSGNIPLSLLADLCHVSEPYFRRLFHKAFSTSPAVYMRNMRIHYAKELLKSGEYSVTTVAALAGFNDTAYFSREFKKAAGVSPKD